MWAWGESGPKCLEPGSSRRRGGSDPGSTEGAGRLPGEGLFLYLTPPTPLPGGCVSGPSVCRQVRWGRAGAVGREAERGGERWGEVHSVPGGEPAEEVGEGSPVAQGAGHQQRSRCEPEGQRCYRPGLEGQRRWGQSGAALALGACVASVPTQSGGGWHAGAALPVTAGLGVVEPRAASWARVGSMRRDRGRDARAPHGPARRGPQSCLNLPAGSRGLPLCTHDQRRRAGIVDAAKALLAWGSPARLCRE